MIVLHLLKCVNKIISLQNNKPLKEFFVAMAVIFCQAFELNQKTFESIKVPFQQQENSTYSEAHREEEDHHKEHTPYLESLQA